MLCLSPLLSGLVNLADQVVQQFGQPLGVVGLSSHRDVENVDVARAQVGEGKLVGVKEHGVGHALVLLQVKGNLSLDLIKVRVADAVAHEEQGLFQQQPSELVLDPGEATEVGVIVLLGDDDGVRLLSVTVQFDQRHRVGAGVGQVLVAHDRGEPLAGLTQCLLDQVVVVGCHPGADAQAKQPAMVVRWPFSGCVRLLNDVAD